MTEPHNHEYVKYFICVHCGLTEPEIGGVSSSPFCGELVALEQEWRKEILRRHVAADPRKWDEANGIEWCADALAIALAQSRMSKDGELYT